MPVLLAMVRYASSSSSFSFPVNRLLSQLGSFLFPNAFVCCYFPPLLYYFLLLLLLLLPFLLLLLLLPILLLLEFSFPFISHKIFAITGIAFHCQLPHIVTYRHPCLLPYSQAPVYCHLPPSLSTPIFSHESHLLKPLAFSHILPYSQAPVFPHLLQSLSPPIFSSPCLLSSSAFLISSHLLKPLSFVIFCHPLPCLPLPFISSHRHPFVIPSLSSPIFSSPLLSFDIHFLASHRHPFAPTIQSLSSPIFPYIVSSPCFLSSSAISSPIFSHPVKHLFFSLLFPFTSIFPRSYLLPFSAIFSHLLPSSPNFSHLQPSS